MKKIIVAAFFLVTAAHADNLKLTVRPSTGEIVVTRPHRCGSQITKAVRGIVSKAPRISLIDANMIVTAAGKERDADRYGDPLDEDQVVGFFDEPDGKIISVAIHRDPVVTAHADHERHYRRVEITMTARDDENRQCHETWLGLAEI
jgi:hypothetical protein